MAVNLNDLNELSAKFVEMLSKKEYMGIYNKKISSLLKRNVFFNYI